MKITTSHRGKIIFILACFLAASTLIAAVLLLKPSEDKPKYEVETHLSFTNVSGVVRVNNPYGLIQVLPSEDEILRVEVTKIARSPKFLHKEGGLPQIEVRHEQNGPDIDFELIYHSPGGKNLYTDLFLFCPPLKKIEVRSKQGNIWLGAVEANVVLQTEGKDQQIAIAGLKGDLDLLANEGEIRIDAPDNRKLNLRFNHATTKVAFTGKSPGPVQIIGQTGRITTSFISGTNARVQVSTKGMFFSNLSDTDLKEGKYKSDGKPIKKQLGQGGSTISLQQSNGEITLNLEEDPQSSKPSEKKSSP